MYTAEEYKVYLKVRHDLLLQDARNAVADWLAYRDNCYPWDIDDKELDKYDYEYLVDEFEEHEDCNVSFNGQWEFIVNNYMNEPWDTDFEEED